MSRISFCLALCVLLAPNAVVGTTFREEEEAGVTAHTHSIDDYGRPPGIETGCSTVMGVQQPVEDPVDRGDASEDMNVLLFEVTRPGHFHELSPPPLGHYDTPHALYEALQNPTMNYTVLVPPSESLAFLPKALGHGLMTHAQALSILMLHIIPGRFGARDLTLAANDGQKLESVGGELLELQEPAFSLNVLFSYHNSSATFVTEDLLSCKPGSVVHHVDSMLSALDMQAMKDEYENLLEADADTEAQQESGGKKRLSNGAVALIVLAILVCTPFCCLGWKRWAAHIDTSKDKDSECSEMEAINHMHANRVSPEKLLPFERWIQKRPEQTAPVSPKVLYRMDDNLWSTMPPCPSPRSSSFKRIQMQMHDNLAFAESDADGDDRSNPFFANSTKFGNETGTECSICCEHPGDHVLLPCGHSGYCGDCAQSLFRSSAEGNSCGQCPVCRAPLTAVVRVPVDTPVGCSGVILEVSAGGFTDGGGGAISCSPGAAQDRQPQRLDLLGPKYSVNPIAEFSTSHTVEVEEEPIRIAATRGRDNSCSGGSSSAGGSGGGSHAPMRRVSAEGVPKEDSSMEGVASFMVWEEQASEAGFSESRASFRRDGEGREADRRAAAEAERRAVATGNNPIAFW